MIIQFNLKNAYRYFDKLSRTKLSRTKLNATHWYIFDSSGIKSEVAGDGVVGVQPILVPGQSYQYVSGCNLTTVMGKMHGIYLMEREIDGKLFNVKIPEFLMIVPYKLN